MEKELLEQFNVSICEFTSQEWSRNGFIDPINRVVYINKDLAPEIRLKVILHELGHLEHNSKDYERLREKYEAQANRDMIRGLLENESFVTNKMKNKVVEIIDNLPLSCPLK